MWLLVAISVGQLLLSFLIWSALLELLGQQPSEQDRSSQAIADMERQTLHAMFAAARAGEVIEGRATEQRS